MNTLLPTLLEELQQKIMGLKNSVIREVKLSSLPNKIVVAIGMRRTGKTYFLLQIIERLIKENVALNRILYINFEDDRLYPLTAKKLSSFLDGFYTLYPENHDQLCYLFLDEIQNIENWQVVIRRYFDTQKVQIYLTGSSAKLLSKEIATSLRGRSIATEIWPFSFTEFLSAKHLSLPKTYGKKNLDKLMNWLKAYITQGGFPEILSFHIDIENKLLEIWAKILGVSKINVHDNFFDLGGHSLHILKLTLEIKKKLNLNLNVRDLIRAPTITAQKKIIEMIEEEDRRRVLQDYLHGVIFRDIVERYKITNISLIRYMINFLLKNVGRSFAVNKFFNDLKSQAFSVSKTTIHDYLGYIEDAYLAFTVPLYDESLRKVQSNPRKIYAVDTGLVNACTFSFSENIGHYFKNIIYLDLRRARHEIYYYLTKTRKEVNFLTQDPRGKWHLFQVCWDMENTETWERETAALREAEKELKIKGECITPTSYFISFLPAVRNIQVPE